MYVGAEDVPIEFANQFVIQYQRGEYILTVGQIAPPILLGTEEEQKAEAEQVAYVPVKVISRLGFTPRRLRELVQVSQSHLEKFDNSERGNEDADS